MSDVCVCFKESESESESESERERERILFIFMSADKNLYYLSIVKNRRPRLLRYKSIKINIDL
jgi:hypothetical protein